MIQSQPVTRILRKSTPALIAVLMVIGLLASASRGLAATLTWTNTVSDVWTSLTAWQTNPVDVATNTISPPGTVNLGCLPDVNAIVGGIATNITTCTSVVGGSDGFPALADSARFTNSATYAVTVNVTTNVSAITFSNTAGVVTMGAGVNTLTVTGLFRVADGGATSTVYWSGGTLTLGNQKGEFDIASNSTNSLGVFAVTNGTVTLGPLTQVGRSGAASVGSFVISGPGVVTNTIGETGSFQVRGPGNGQYSQLIITNGGKLFISPPAATDSLEVFSNGMVLVSDPGSLLSLGYDAGNAIMEIGGGSITAGTPGSLMIVSNGATVFGDGTISWGRASSFNTGIVCGAGSKLISGSPTNGDLVIGISGGSSNELIVYNGGYVSTSGTLDVPDGTGTFNGFQMGGTGLMSTGFAVAVKNNSSSTNSLIQVTNAVFTCSQMAVSGDSNALSVLANGTLILSNQYAITASVVTDVLEVSALSGPGTLLINAGTISAVSGTNAFEVRLGASTALTGNSITITNGGKLLSELAELGDSSSYNTTVVTGVGSVWSNWTSSANSTTNTITVGEGSLSSYNYLAVQSGASLYNNGDLRIGVTNVSPNNTAIFGGVGAASTIVNSGHLEVGVDGQTFGNTLVVTNASLTCGILSVGGTGATNNFLTLNAGTITVNGPVDVEPSNTVTFTAGVLAVGSMAFVSTANNGNAFVVGDGTDAAIYAMYTGDTGYHYFGSGLVVTNGATLEGNGTLVGNVTVLGTFAPGFGVGSIYASNNLTFASSAMLDYDLGTISDSVTVNSNLTLAGTLNINNAGGFASGNTYLLFTYNGTLTYNGVSIGSTPIAGPTYTINTNTPGQVNLVVTGSGSSNPFVTWQTYYYGCTGCPQAQPNVFPGGKGFSNTNLFMAGFNPTTNSATYPHVISVAKTNNNIDIRVTYLGANGDSSYSGGPTVRTNVLEFTTGTANGSYTNNFASTGQTNILSGGTGLGVVTNMVDSGGATNKPSRYYRVRVLLP
jgi:fibronectin-binding autotransporter adhesin